MPLLYLLLSVSFVGATDFQARHDSILEGEKSAQAALLLIREAIRKASLSH
jgi:NTE family protein